MGGTVAVCLRKPNKEEFRMLRWTNRFPDFIHNLKFLEKDEDYINEYLSTWKDMKQDWEENNKTGNFKFNMTEVYAPYDNKCLYPCDYGLIVIDMANDKILSLQGRTSIQFLPLVSLSARRDDEEFISAYEKLHKLRRFSKIIDMISGKEIASKEENFGNFFGEKYKTNGSCSYAKILLDLSPFSVESFPETKEGVLSIKKRVLELGFEISEEENEEWNDFANSWEDRI